MHRVGFEEITVTGAAQALTVPTRAMEAICQVQGDQVRIRVDGTAPTATVGLVLDDVDVRRYRMPSTTIRWFGYGHLPEHLQKVSEPVGELAAMMEAMLPDGAEKSAGMRKLLEAKDCFVRASLDGTRTEEGE